MKCEACDKEYRTKFTRSTVFVDGKPIHFENMPVLVCPHCGQSHIPGDVIEKAKLFARTMTSTVLDYELCEDVLAEQAHPMQIQNI